jgi:hypothetical protein
MKSIRRLVARAGQSHLLLAAPGDPGRAVSIGMAQLACIVLRRRKRRRDCVAGGGQMHGHYTRRINFREGWHGHFVLHGGPVVQQGLE